MNASAGAALCLFVAVLCGGLAVLAWLQTRHRRLWAVLGGLDEAVAPAPAPRDRLRSAAELLGRPLLWFSPAGRLLAGDDLGRRLQWAGRDLAPERFAAARLLVAAAATVLAIPLGLTVGGSLGAGPGVVLAATLGYMLPEAWLQRAVRHRRAAIDREVLLYADFLATALTVDQTVESALVRVHRELGGIVAAALARAARAQARVGQPAEVALLEAAARLGHPDVSAIVAVLAESQRYGASIAGALHGLSDSLRQQRRERLRERANRLGTLMVLPVSIFLLPSLLVIIGFPALLSLRSLGAL